MPNSDKAFLFYILQKDEDLAYIKNNAVFQAYLKELEQDK